MHYGSLSGTSLRHVAVAFSFTFASIASHWGLWRWIGSSWPTWLSKHRVALVVFMIAAWAVPVVVPMEWSAPPSRSAVDLVSVAMLWQFVVAASMCGLYGGRLAVRGSRAIRAWAAKTPQHERGSATGVARLEPPPATSSLMTRRVLIERACGALALGASASALGWGMVCGRREWSIEDVPIRLDRLPKALDGFTIVQLSDIHVGAFVGERDLADGLGRIARLKPDLIVVTGDILDRDPRYIPLAAKHLGALQARFGVTCILGNHDHYTGPALVLDALRRVGIHVLRNDAQVLLPGDGGGIALLGLDDLAGGHRGAGWGPDLAKAQSQVSQDIATVLLVHQPTYVDRVLGKGIDLQLSGHTHGGQINPGFSVAGLISPYVAGKYDVQGTTLYVNRGFGTVGPPARLGAAPEITRITLVAT